MNFTDTAIDDQTTFVNQTLKPCSPERLGHGSNSCPLSSVSGNCRKLTLERPPGLHEQSLTTISRLTVMQDTKVLSISYASKKDRHHHFHDHVWVNADRDGPGPARTHARRLSTVSCTDRLQNGSRRTRRTYSIAHG
jgi:hypothetical protein